MMESSMVMPVLDRVQRISRNAEKTLAFECKRLQSSLDSLPVDMHEQVKALRSAGDYIDQMKCKILECSNSKGKLFTVCKKRLEFSKDAGQDDTDRLLDYLLCDYLCRRGFLQSAKLLTSLSNLTDLIDIGIFEQHAQILFALKNRDTDPALRWCQANRARLQAIQSSLELYLRLRNFVALVVKRDFFGAIQYVKTYMLPDFKAQMAVLKRHLGLIALFSNADAQAYSDLLDDSRWTIVQSMFSEDFFKVQKISADPHLDLYLKTGLCALKSQSCGTPNKSISDCPVCSQDVVELAAKLKAAPKTISCLVCRLTGDVMDESNPPMAVPNGQVYSKAGLHSLALMNDGKVRCPETGINYSLSDCKHVFVL